jgi:hypothetical protein
MAKTAKTAETAKTDETLDLVRSILGETEEVETEVVEYIPYFTAEELEGGVGCRVVRKSGEDLLVLDAKTGKERRIGAAQVVQRYVDGLVKDGDVITVKRTGTTKAKRSGLTVGEYDIRRYVAKGASSK